MWKRIAGLALLGLAAAFPAVAQPVAPLHIWTELVDGGVVEARAIVSGGICPDIVIDGHAQPMPVRAAPDPSFPQTVCALRLPPHAQSASVGDVRLALPKVRIDRIVVLGDTGCRVKAPDVQACNDPRAWPFGLVARQAASEHPDLVIHVGDYYYRESACPPLYAGCVDTPHGDLWPSWAADFFDPARPLLAAAPWVFARGNHESCSRGWKGWFRMLDAGPSPDVCPSESQPFAVPIGGVTLHVLDSADAVDRFAPKGPVALVEHQLATIPGGHEQDAWIVTHRPIWGEVPVFRLGPFGPFNVGLNVTEQTAVRGKDLSSVAMIVSGHIHHFASFDFGPNRPAQLIAGTGGDLGEKADTPIPQVDTVMIDGMEARTLTFERFGYVLLERQAVGWAGVFRDLDGKVVARCRLVGRALTCGAAVS
jgi:hypothetical protein